MRTRTTKKLAQRIDLNYFKRTSPYKRARFWLSLLLPILAFAWIAWRSLAKDSRVYSSGPMSAAHAVLEKQCSACHVQKAGTFSAKAADSACLACHDGPIHHATAGKTLACASCHSEHRGRINISTSSNQACAECHADLRAFTGSSRYANHIRSLQDGHPQFAALREGATDPGTIKLNHAVHLKPIRRGPNGPLVQLECGDCHRCGAVVAQWTYGDTRYMAVNHSYSDQEEVRPLTTGTFSRRTSMTGRELMAPVKFATACAACHLLSFDKRFDEGVPHDKPEVVHALLLRRFGEYIASHPSEVRVARDPKRDLTGRPMAPEVRLLTPSQWVAERTADAEELLWRKTCKQCHSLTQTSSTSPPQMRGSIQPADSVPQVAPAKITARWMPHANFDHDAHRGFTCAGCHQKALTSTESSDVLVPGIATCQSCHAPGLDHAESSCSECHTYHDWAKRKEVTPRFTLPALGTGGS